MSRNPYGNVGRSRPTEWGSKARKEEAKGGRVADVGGVRKKGRGVYGWELGGGGRQREG